LAGGPVEIEMSVRIDAPPEVVWEYLVDWENLDRWMIEGRGFRVTSEHREGLGVTAEASIRVGGITTTDPVEVTRWEPPETLEISHRGWVAGKGLMECRPAPWGTFLFWKETLYPPLWVPGAIGLRLFKPILRRTFERDLGLLKGRRRAIGFTLCLLDRTNKRSSSGGSGWSTCRWVCWSSVCRWSFSKSSPDSAYG
jgi:uncharacterized membrane protein